jgi:phosphate-selective porin OprO and OprP
MLKRDWGLLATAAVFAAGSASAQQVDIDAAKVEQVQRQMQQLQEQMQRQNRQLQEQMQQLKTELAEAKKKADEAKRPTSAFEGAYAAAVVPKAPADPPSPIVLMSRTNAPSICTADQQNCIGLTGRLHFDFGGYNYRPATGLGLGPSTGLTPGVPIQPATTPQSLDDGVNIRRARIGTTGKFMGDWNYALIYDFGGSSDGFGGLAPGSLPGGGTSGIENAWLSYSGFTKYTGLSGFLIEGGVNDMGYTLDEATSSNDIMFLERASAQVIATSIAAGDFRTYGGLRGYNDWFWAGGFATGPLTGAIHSDTTSVTGLVPAGCTSTVAGVTCNTVNVSTLGASEQYGSTARVSFQPLTGQNYSLHIGGDFEMLFSPPVGPAGTNLAGRRVLTLSDRPELRIDPTVLLNTGVIAGVSHAEVYSVEAAAAWGPLFFQGEYFWFQIDRENATTPNTSAAPNIPGGLPSLHFNGGYAEASWTFTGESRPYNPVTGSYGRVTPFNPVNVNGTGRGAWEIAARYSVMNLNDDFGAITGIEGGKQSIITAGLNWYVNTNIAFKLNYLHGIFEKQALPTATIPGITNVGANFDAIAGRMQIAF